MRIYIINFAINISYDFKAHQKGTLSLGMASWKDYISFYIIREGERFQMNLHVTIPYRLSVMITREENLLL